MARGANGPSAAEVEAAADLLEQLAGTTDEAPLSLSADAAETIIAGTDIKMNDGSSALAADEKLWSELSSRKVPAGSIGTAMTTLIGADKTSKAAALRASAAYAALLGSADCPTFSVFNSVGFSELLRVLRDACCGTGAAAAPAAQQPARGRGKGKGAKGKGASSQRPADADDDEMQPAAAEEELDGATVGRLVSVIMRGIHRMLATFPLKDQPVTMKARARGRSRGVFMRLCALQHLPLPLGPLARRSFPTC